MYGSNKIECLCLYLYLYNSTFGKNSTGARPHHGTGSCILGNHKDVQYGSRISSQKNHEAQRNVPQKHEGQRNVTAVKEIMLYSPPTYVARQNLLLRAAV